MVSAALLLVTQPFGLHLVARTAILPGLDFLNQEAARVKPVHALAALPTAPDPDAGGLVDEVHAVHAIAGVKVTLLELMLQNLERVHATQEFILLLRRDGKSQHSLPGTAGCAVEYNVSH